MNSARPSRCSAALRRPGARVVLCCSGWASTCCCAAPGGSCLAAASLWLRVDVRSERASTGGGVWARVGSRSAGRGTQGSAFVREGAKDAAFVFGSRHQRSIVRASAREGRILRPRASVRGGWAGILPLRVTVHEKGESLPSRAPSRRHDACFARHGPREGSIVRGSHSNGESWPRPADPPEPRPPAPVEAFRRPPRRAATATQPQARSQPHPADPTGPRPTVRSRPFRRPPRSGTAATQQRANARPGRSSRSGRRRLRPRSDAHARRRSAWHAAGRRGGTRATARRRSRTRCARSATAGSPRGAAPPRCG